MLNKSSRDVIDATSESLLDKLRPFAFPYGSRSFKALSASRSKFRSSSRIIQKVHDCFRERVGRLRGDQNAALTMLHNLRNSAYRRPNDGRPTAHSLEKNQSKRFVQGRRHEERRAFKPVLHFSVRQTAKKLNLGTNLWSKFVGQILRMRSFAGAVRTIGTNENKPGVRMLFNDQRRRSHKIN